MQLKDREHRHKSESGTVAGSLLFYLWLSPDDDDGENSHPEIASRIPNRGGRGGGGGGGPLYMNVLRWSCAACV